MPQFTSEARVSTSEPARYMAQLCKHFAHRRPASYDETSGSISFDAGTCRLEVEPEVLVMRVETEDEAALPQIEDVVARHLARFSWREPPVIEWRREA